MEEIRNEIDSIDFEIIRLIGLRYQYVKEIVRYKEKTIESVVAGKRKAFVIEKRKEWAALNGLEPDLIEEIYQRLIEYFINKEMQIINLQTDNKEQICTEKR